MWTVRLHAACNFMCVIF